MLPSLLESPGAVCSFRPTLYCSPSLPLCLLFLLSFIFFLVPCLLSSTFLAFITIFLLLHFTSLVYGTQCPIRKQIRHFIPISLSFFSLLCDLLKPFLSISNTVSFSTSLSLFLGLIHHPVQKSVEGVPFILVVLVLSLYLCLLPPFFLSSQFWCEIPDLFLPTCEQHPKELPQSLQIFVFFTIS